MNTLDHCLVLLRLLWYLRSCKMMVVVVVVVVVVLKNFVVVDIVVTDTQKIVVAVVVAVGSYYCNMLTMLKLCTLVNLWSL